MDVVQVWEFIVEGLQAAPLPKASRLRSAPPLFAASARMRWGVNGETLLTSFREGEIAPTIKTALVSSALFSSTPLLLLLSNGGSPQRSCQNNHFDYRISDPEIPHTTTSLPHNGFRDEKVRMARCGARQARHVGQETRGPPVSRTKDSSILFVFMSWDAYTT